MEEYETGPLALQPRRTGAPQGIGYRGLARPRASARLRLPTAI